jgi:hypothetical protein
MYWLVWVLIAIFGAALFARVRSVRASRGSAPIFPTPPPLRPGESYDDSVKLTTVPNVPLADLWCQRLRDEGIEAFYKPAPYLTSFYGGAATNPGLPQEIWVGEHSAERAAQLMRELG